MKNSKIVIAVDMDEVLCGTIDSIIEFHNQMYSTTLVKSDFNSYNYEDVWGGSTEEAIEKVRLFYSSEHFKERVQPVPGAYEALKKLHEFYKLVVVTARQEIVHEETHKFLQCNFEGIFDEVHFGNHFLTPEETTRGLRSKSKSEICMEIGAAFLIDDSIVHANDCANIGIKVFLFDHEGYL